MQYRLYLKLINLWDDFKLHSYLAPTVLKILFVALGRKNLCTTAIACFFLFAGYITHNMRTL